MMRIGVVCEGPSDYPAIASFIGNALFERGIKADFRALFPNMDKTRPEGGWANVFTWLARYPAPARVQTYFAGGLFGGNLSSERLDAIIIQLDSDILDDESFKKFVSKNYGISFLNMKEPLDRAGQIVLILESALCLNQITNSDALRHISLPAGESTEAWCVSAFSGQPIKSNRLAGIDLTTAFMRALELSESKKPNDIYANIDKSQSRRRDFCKKHAKNSSRIMRDCESFSKGVKSLVELYQAK